MTTIATANAGGSAGKTTTVVATAALLARAGHEVKVIDLDGQHNCSTILGYDQPTTPTIGDVLQGRATLDQATVPTGIPGLSLVPSTRELDAEALQLSGAIGGEQRLRQALEASATPADVTLIDCPGSIGILTIAALVAADAVITVATPSIKEISGIPPLQQTVLEVATAYNPKLQLAAVIPTVVPSASRGAAYAQALDLLRETFGDMVSPPVRQAVAVVEAYSHQMPVTEYAPQEGVSADYRDVLGFLQDRGVL
ncbi:ParA family protein [Pimelobacter sp. 30-1]|uniref:ParA family protein n=1 Tax=Pimelobacter sp. 30-1 TaxID=2004991 RepID=UPI001C049FE0|nr:ParA family protein [Pimelobacter sp. 30-1]MBU2698908.1 hypothetical protein [Pimelobacter sp. 30-1]